MRRRLLALCAGAVVALSSVTIAAAAATSHASTANDACASKHSKWEHDQCEKFIHSAPGDEYFGRMKMSYLGINNTFRDETIRAGSNTTDPGIINKVSFAEEALNQWASRYPGDPQLARSYFLAVQIFKKIYTQDAQQKAWHYMQMLVSHFPASYFGKLEKTDIARGFTEHWYAVPTLCPMPGSVAAALPSNGPPTPDPKPGQPKVEIITPPCVMPTPTPSPTPLETATPQASGSPSPVPSPAPTRHP